MSDAPATKSPPRAKQSAFAQGEPPRPAGSRLAWLLFLVMAGLICAVELPNEINAWKYAAALEARDAGKQEVAYQILNDLHVRNPQNSRYSSLLYSWNLEDRNFKEALVVLDQMFQVGGSARKLLSLRSGLYLQLGRYPEALDDCRELKRISDASGVPSQADALNGLAYTRAVGNFELNQAALDSEAAVIAARRELDEAEQELKTLQQAWFWFDTSKARVKLFETRSNYLNCLDTRGFIRTKTDELQAAQVDLDEAIQGFEVKIATPQLSRRVRKYRDLEAAIKQANSPLAVIYYHRSLNLQKLGREAEAKRDFDKARLLSGREPDESLF